MKVPAKIDLSIHQIHRNSRSPFQILLTSKENQENYFQRHRRICFNERPTKEKESATTTTTPLPPAESPPGIVIDREMFISSK